MDRNLHNAMMAQYATQKASGNGFVSWNGGVKCVLPSVKLYGAAVQDGAPTPDAPITPVCNDGVFVGRGKNLIKFPYYYKKDVVKNGITIRENADRSISISGTATSTVYYNLDFDGSDLIPGETYVFSLIGGLGNVNFEVGCFLSGGGYKSLITATSIQKAKVLIPDGYVKNRIFFYIPTGRTVNETVYPILVHGDAAADIYTPYWDGGQATAPELWAIPGTGIRDEWDCQTGYGVRRVGKKVFDGLNSGDVSFHGTKGNYGEFRFENISNRLADAASFSDYYQVGDAIGEFETPRRSAIFPVGITSIGSYMPFVHEGITDITEYRTWLSNHPVTVWYALAELEPFYLDPARLTQPNGPGQIIHVSGSAPDCPIEAKYLTHTGGAAT